MKNNYKEVMKSDRIDKTYNLLEKTEINDILSRLEKTLNVKGEVSGEIYVHFPGFMLTMYRDSMGSKKLSISYANQNIMEKVENVLQSYFNIKKVRRRPERRPLTGEELFLFE
jgi:hypothetical protein